jgi:hypothetical protein
MVRNREGAGLGGVYLSRSGKRLPEKVGERVRINPRDARIGKVEILRQ